MKRQDEHTISSGYLAVGDGHELFYEVWGNPEAPSVVFFHGGPGYHYTTTDKQLFNPEQCHVVFYDQRAAGQSKYRDPFKSNNTSKLIDDVEKLRQHVGFRKTVLVGGSWGSTMALLYAMTNPHMVHAIVLRAFFPANKECIDVLTDGANSAIIPREYLNFINLVPRDSRHNILAYYAKHLRSGNDQLKRNLAGAWHQLGMALGRITGTGTGTGTGTKYTIRNAAYRKRLLTATEGYESTGDEILHAAITAHYAHHNCFLPDDYIHQNISRLDGIPIEIIHGTRDLLCPISFARRFAEQSEDVRLREVDAGHSASDENMFLALRRAIAHAIESVGND